MPGRLNLGPLFGGVRDGLRKRRHVGEEPADTTTRRILVGIPLCVAILSLALRLHLSHADQLIAGTALFIGVLIAVFIQVAVWHDRLSERGRSVDGVRLRALREAGAHILVDVLAAMLTTASMVVVANISIPDKSPDEVVLWSARAFTALGLCGFTYIFLSMLIVLNLLWDAFTSADQKRASRAA